MSQDSLIPVANNAKSRNDLIERGFSRQPLRIDVDIARSLEALAHAAWSIPKDKYYDGGDRYRSLNRLRRPCNSRLCDDFQSRATLPAVQLSGENGSQPRRRGHLCALGRNWGCGRAHSWVCREQRLVGTAGSRPDERPHSRRARPAWNREIVEAHRWIR